MKYIFVILLLTLMAIQVSGQSMMPYNEDSLRSVLQSKRDTVAVDVLLKLAGSYFFKDPTTSLSYAQTALDSSRRLNFEKGTIKSLVHAAEANRMLGNFIQGLKLQREANELSKKSGDKMYEANSTGFIGIEYFELQHFDEALSYLKRAEAMRKVLKYDPVETLYTVFIGRAYTEKRSYDSAYYFLKEALDRKWSLNGPGLLMLTYYSLGDYYFHIGQTDSAYFYFKSALKIAGPNARVVPNHVSLTAAKLSSLFSLKNQPDSSLYFARLGFKIARDKKLDPRILETSRQLAELHRQIGNTDSILYYQDIAIAVNDSIFGRDKINELELMQLEDQRRNHEIQQAQERYQNNILIIGLVSITTIILVASLLLFRSNRIKQKTNVVLQQTLSELKATQSQLIQSEKMASLGELTAGIAHEIQNPLNFVNNFSEVNSELLDDLKKELSSGNVKAAEELVRNIEDNEHKVNHHGKRADAIVKSMLQHSKTSSGQKEVTDINALCDEYTRLAFHGYRAKDKSFNAKFETLLDSSLPKVNVAAQEIGRVVLNLLNNAGYAVNEKRKTMEDDYLPTVTLSTKRLDNKIEIRVRDNGGGIPESIKEKIFQPFFTNKPTGQGTGLGLSLSYDIIKAHGGTLEVKSKEGEGSEFIIQLLL